MRCFLVRIEKSSKVFKIQPKTCKKCHVFEDFSILTEKQRMKPQNLISHKNLASFDTLVDPKATKVRNEMLWRSFKPVCESFVRKCERHFDT